MSAIVTGVSHCASSGACVLAIEGYHDFVGNSIGRGNRRLFALFLLLAGLTCALFAVLSWSAHMHGLCPNLPNDKGTTTLQHNTPHHNTPQHDTPATPHHTTSHHTTSHHTTYPILSYPVPNPRLSILSIFIYLPTHPTTPIGSKDGDEALWWQWMKVRDTDNRY